MVALAHARRDVPRFLQQSPAEPPRAFRPRLEAAPVVLEGHTEAALRHAAIVAGVELGVFAPLAEGPLPAEGVADALGLESARLAPLLDALALHLGQHQRLLEIGADGGLAIAACEVHPALHAIAATSEAMLGTTRRLVEEAALDRRLQVRGLPTAAGPLLAECDAVLVWDVLQPRSAPQFLEVLRAASSALVPGARLHLFGWIRDDRGLAPAGAVLRALLGDLAGGPAREGEVRAGLLQAGFFDVVRRPAPEGIGPPGLSHIAARRA